MAFFVVGCLGLVIYQTFSDNGEEPIAIGRKPIKTSYGEPIDPNLITEAEKIKDNERFIKVVGDLEEMKINNKKTIEEYLNVQLSKNKTEEEHQSSELSFEPPAQNPTPKVKKTESDLVVADSLTSFGKGDFSGVIQEVGNYEKNKLALVSEELVKQNENKSTLDILDEAYDISEPSVSLPQSRPKLAPIENRELALYNNEKDSLVQGDSSAEQMVWFSPVDVTISHDKDGNVVKTYPSIVGRDNSEPLIVGGDNDSRFQDPVAEQGIAKQPSEPELIPYATINLGAKFVASKNLTSLIGIVPLSGDVADPHPFSVRVGAQNLATNGQTIDGIANMEFYGIAKGDYSRSCVRGYITAMTYTFEDGTIRTLTTETASTTGIDAFLGYLTNDEGDSCIKGTVSSDIPEYMSVKTLMAGIGAYGAAFADGETEKFTDISSSTVTEVVTGDIAKYAAGEAVRAGVSDASEIVDALYSAAQVSIWVPNNTRLNVNITRQLNIDYDPAGRKINYDYSSIPQSFVTELH